MDIPYHTETRIHLSLEDYHNAGISSDRSREIIEGIIDPTPSQIYSSGWNKLRCSPSGINSNWIVDSNATTKEDVEDIISLIRWHLSEELGLIK